MKARFAGLATVAAACSLAISAYAAGEIRTHRTKAGTFAGGSWALAESTEGRFSVLLPAPFDDYTQTSNTGDDRNGYFLKSKLPDTTLFSAVRAEYADAAEATQNCQRMLTGPAFGAHLESRRKLEVQGHVAVELTVNDGRAWMQMRVICLETEGMILAVAAPLDKIAEAKVLAAKFFDSLKFRPKGD